MHTLILPSRKCARDGDLFIDEEWAYCLSGKLVFPGIPGKRFSAKIFRQHISINLELQNEGVCQPCMVRRDKQAKSGYDPSPPYWILIHRCF